MESAKRTVMCYVELINIYFIETLNSCTLDHIKNNINFQTCVSEQGTNLKFLSKWTRAIFTSSKASLLPIQFLGPAPKGIH